ncbi:transposase [Aestuariibaculum sp. M13]|uniref:transposase n=1 Tax=Aestuariibaculum sp. M13 TaxID=2967132 RepID=UPI002159FD14|nr:transposase [Aestuariibaculum sp. M13]MCR8668717.1 transposase [Aestuariibaculum sp. M13]
MTVIMIRPEIRLHNFNNYVQNYKEIGRYNESFKFKILDELTAGKLNKNYLGRLYGTNPTSINEWIRKYERKDLMNTRIKVETKDEITLIKELQKEIEQLKKILLKLMPIKKAMD